MDIKLCNYLKFLIGENEQTAIVFLLSELKMFLKDLSDYFRNNSKGTLEVIYEHRIGKTTNVIYK